MPTDDSDHEKANVGHVRDGNGTFIYTVDHAKRDERAARRRAEGWSYQRIADEFGFNHRSDARKAVERVLKATVQEAGDELRQLERERLDRLSEAAWKVLDRKHVTVNNGRVINVDGEPLLDDAPVLQAIDRLLRISESRRKLEGLDAPARVSVDAENLGREIDSILGRISGTSDDDSTDS